MKFNIPLSYNPIDSKSLSEVLGRYGDEHHNKMIGDFEDEFKKLMKAPNAVALNSGTSAIHLALKVLGVSPGDCVIVPTFTYVATVNPILYQGAYPVFVDSESETWNMDPALLQKAIQLQIEKKQKPKAIIVVHTYGMPSHMNAIMKLAAEHNIPVIEDAAESLGSVYQSKNVGLIGDVGIYSFNNNKVITTYGGGILVTRNPEHSTKARFLASQARENLPYYEHHEVGHNYAMSPLSAAYGLSQLPRLSENISDRRRVYQWYHKRFLEEGLQFQEEKEGSVSNRWFTTILFRNEATRLAVSSVLQSEAIETRPLWRPMHLQPLYRNAEAYISGIAQNLHERGLCLPSGRGLTEKDFDKISNIMQSMLQKFGN